MDIWQSVYRDNLEYVTKIPAALGTLIAAYFLIKLAKRFIRTAAGLARLDKTVVSMLTSTVSFVGWVFAFSAALNVVGLSQLSLALGGSVALVAMALATGLNNVAQDLLSGIFLLSDQDFVVGKKVKAGGVEGVVVSLTVRKTKIRDANGDLHTVPNRNVDQNAYVIYADEQEDEDAGTKAG